MSTTTLWLSMAVLCSFAFEVNAGDKECINHIIVDKNKHCLSSPVARRTAETKPVVNEKEDIDDRDVMPGDVTEYPDLGTEEPVGDIETNLLLEQKPTKE